MKRPAWKLFGWCVVSTSPMRRQTQSELQQPRRLMLLNLPDPSRVPPITVSRGYAGGFGVAGPAADKLLPTFLLYAASAARNKECPHTVLDAQAMAYDASRVLDAVTEAAPDVLVSWLSLPSVNDDLELLGRVKKASPKTVTIGLGSICNVMPEEVLSGESLDMVVKGAYPFYKLVSALSEAVRQAPETLYSLPGAVYKKDSLMVSNPAAAYEEDLNSLRFDTYSELHVTNYFIRVRDKEGSPVDCVPVLTGVGCPYSCAYCPYPVGYGHRPIRKSAMRIVEEIEFLRNSFGITGFLFRDQAFTQDSDRAFELCDHLAKREVGVRWYIEARVDQVSEELLERMKQAGCFRIHYGVETGSPELLASMGKPGVKMEKVREAFRMTREAGLATTAHMILGLPGENRETLESSLNLLFELNPDSVNLNIATPYPGTRLFEMARKEGWISTYDWSKYTGYNAVMAAGDMSIPELYRARKEMLARLRNHRLRHDPGFRKAYSRGLPAALRKRLPSPRSVLARFMSRM